MNFHNLLRYFILEQSGGPTDTFMAETTKWNSLFEVQLVCCLWQLNTYDELSTFGIKKKVGHSVDSRVTNPNQHRRHLGIHPYAQAHFGTWLLQEQTCSLTVMWRPLCRHQHTLLTNRQTQQRQQCLLIGCGPSWSVPHCCSYLILRLTVHIYYRM